MTDKIKRKGLTAEEQALFDYQDAGAEYIENGPAQYQQGAGLEYDDLNPEDLAQLERSGMNNIQVDPQYRDAELDALRSLEEQSETGLTARDQADMAKLQGQVGRSNRGRIGAIQQNMAARGLGGSGLEMVSQMQAAQDAADREAVAALEQGAIAGERRNQATNQRAALAGQMGDRSFNQQAQTASANDVIARFNATNKINTQQSNQAGQNQVNTQNWQRANQTADNNVNAGQAFQKDKMGVGQGNAKVAFDYAAAQREAAEQRARDRKAKNSGKNAMIGSVVGGAAGSFFGPAGTAAGASLGGQVGGQFAHGGLVGGPEITPDDDEANDIIPATLSAGEIVLPKSVARDPNKAASFVAKEQGKNSIDPMVLEHLAKSNPDLVAQYKSRIGSAEQGQADAQKMQGYTGVANVFGKALNDYGNSQKSDYRTGVSFDNMGGKMNKAEKSTYDGSAVDKLGAQGVSAADKRLAEIKEQMKQDYLTQRDTDKSAFENKKLEAENDYRTAKERSDLDKFNTTSAYQGKTLEETSRHNKAMEANSRNEAAKKVVAGSQPSNDPLAHVPKELRDNYLGEQTKATSYHTAIEQVKPIIEKLANTKGDAAIPWTAANQQYESDKANAAVAIMGKVDGIRSDADFKNLVEPLLPKPTDRPEVARTKADQLLKLLQGFEPAQSVRDTYPNPKAPAAKGGITHGSDLPD